MTRRFFNIISMVAERECSNGKKEDFFTVVLQKKKVFQGCLNIEKKGVLR